MIQISLTTVLKKVTLFYSQCPAHCLITRSKIKKLTYIFRLKSVHKFHQCLNWLIKPLQIWTKVTFWRLVGTMKIKRTKSNIYQKKTPRFNNFKWLNIFKRKRTEKEKETKNTRNIQQKIYFKTSKPLTLDSLGNF